MTKNTAGSALSPKRKFILLESDCGLSLFVRARAIVAVGEREDPHDDGAVLSHGGMAGEEGYWVRETPERVVDLLEEAED